MASTSPHRLVAGFARRLGIVLAVLGTVGALWPADGVAATGDTPVQALFDLGTPPTAATAPDRRRVELGVRFSTVAPFSAEGVALYRDEDHPLGRAAVRLWDGNALVATGHAAAGDDRGWVRVRFDGGPRVLLPGHDYTASYRARRGRYVTTPDGFLEPLAPAGTPLRAPADAGVYAYGACRVRPTHVREHANYWVTPYGTPADTGPWALFERGVSPAVPVADDPQTAELGVRFTVAASPLGATRITAVRYFRGPTAPMVENRVFVYDDTGAVVGRGLFIGEGGPTGVIDVPLEQPVTPEPGVEYTASYVAVGGRYAVEPGAFDEPVQVGPLTFPTAAGVFTYGDGPPSAQTPAGYYVTPVVELAAQAGGGGSGPPPDTTVPTVEVLEPAAGATVPADAVLYVRARVDDAGGVLRSAALYVDGVRVDGIDGVSPGDVVNLPVRLAPGPHLLEVRADDPAGNVGRAAVDVTAG